MPTLLRNALAIIAALAYRVQIAYVIGVSFLCGGVAASFMIPAPGWFIALDLLAAILPTAWLGIRMGGRLKQGHDGAQQQVA